MQIKTAIVGCGAITRLFHIPSILQNPTFELVALVDPNVDAATKLTKEFGISVHLANDIRDLPPIEAAIVAVPPHLHAELSLALLNKGIHVLCEKPMAMDAEEGKEMIKAAQVGKAVLLIGMQKYYSPNTKLLKDILEDGMLGNIKTFRLICAIKSQWDTANLKRFHPEYAKGGILFEQGIHWIHRIVHWFGYPKLIQYADDRIDGVEVNAFIESEFNAYGQKIHGSQFFSWDHNLKNEITIHGDEGVAQVLEDDISSVFVTREIKNRKKIMGIRNNYAKEKEPLSALQLAYFAECMGSKILVPEPTLLALEALRFVGECYEKRVAVSQPWVFHGIDRIKNTIPLDPSVCG